MAGASGEGAAVTTGAAAGSSGCGAASVSFGRDVRGATAGTSGGDAAVTTGAAGARGLSSSFGVASVSQSAGAFAEAAASLDFVGSAD